MCVKFGTGYFDKNLREHCFGRIAALRFCPYFSYLFFDGVRDLHTMLLTAVSFTTIGAKDGPAARTECSSITAMP